MFKCGGWLQSKKVTKKHHFFAKAFYKEKNESITNYKISTYNPLNDIFGDFPHYHSLVNALITELAVNADDLELTKRKRNGVKSLGQEKLLQRIIVPLKFEFFHLEDVIKSLLEA